MTAGETKRPPALRATLALRSGGGATLRCLRDDDADRLGAYFARLSPRTRDLYGPHPFDQETAERLCLETRADTEVVRFVATVPERDGARIIAYFIVGLRIVGDFQTRKACYDMIGALPAAPPGD